MADNWISDVPGIRDIIDANGVTLPRVARLKLGPGLTATYSQGVITIASSSGGGGGSGGVPAPTEIGQIYAAIDNGAGEPVAAWVPPPSAEVDLPIQAPPNSKVLQGIHQGTGEPIDLVSWYWDQNTNKSALSISNYHGSVEIGSVSPVQLWTLEGNAAEFSATQAWIGGSLNQRAQISASTPSSGAGAWWSYNGAGVGILPKFSNGSSTFDLGPVEPLTLSGSENNSLNASHFGRFNRFSHASAKLRVPPDSGNFPLGTVINCQYTGSGSLTVQEDTGVTVTPSPAGMSRVVQPGGCFTLRKVASNTWILLGALKEAE